MKVICNLTDGYPNLTKGKEYEVKEFIPRLLTTNFTFPRYISVIGDNGKVFTGHAYRFTMLSGQCAEDYMKENIKDKKDY